MTLGDGLFGQSRQPVGVVAEEALDWARFATARQASEFCQSWLNLQCRLVPGVIAGLLLVNDEDGSYAQAAAWPEDSPSVASLIPTARQALQQRRGMLTRGEAAKAGEAGEAHAAYPVDVGGKLWGVVVVSVGARADGALQDVLRRLTWGAGWVETLFYRRQSERDSRHVTTARTALEIVAATGGAIGLHAAATVLASELAVRLDCRRVAVGVLRRGRVRVVALSHATSVGRNLRLAASLANAMEEALDQSAAVAHPPFPGGERRIAVAHRDHVQEARLGSVLSVMLTARGSAIGVITLERDLPTAFDAATVTLCEAVADVAGSVLALQRELSRPLAGSIVRGALHAHRAAFGPRHPTIKLGVAIALCLGAWLAFATGTLRISGKATIEGQVQRALAAPFDGFVATAPHRAGDVVDRGELIAALDTREMELDAVRDESQRDEARLKAQEAEGKHDQAAAAIEGAHAAEADAELAVVREKIARARLVAPFRGLIVSGDLTQKLGSPAEKGHVLFEVAPLDDYRVVVQIDERDLAYVKPGQPAHLVLNGLPSRAMEFAIERIVPVAEAQDGKNIFRVEGRLHSSDDRLRPGMEGIGKTDVETARLAWIWSRPMLDWARLFIWKWWP